MQDLRYPIGLFAFDPDVTDAQRRSRIEDLAALPALLRDAVAPLTDEQLDTPYRSEGWTVRQVVHHIPDSHLNAYVRFRLALTEDEPLIKPYDERAWAELPDARSAPIDVSLSLLEALHHRWVALLSALNPSDWTRRLLHPDWDSPLTLDLVLANYAWHGRHHLAHITGLLERMGWTS